MTLAKFKARICCDFVSREQELLEQYVLDAVNKGNNPVFDWKCRLAAHELAPKDNEAATIDCCLTTLREKGVLE